MKKALILILTLALVLTVFSSCKTQEEPTTTLPVETTIQETTLPVEESTTQEAVTEATTAETTTVEVTTVETTTIETTTQIAVPETTTQAPTTQAPETQAPATAAPTTQAPETTTFYDPNPTLTNVEIDFEDDEDDLSWMDGPESKERAGLIYDGAGRLSSYDKIPEGSRYYEYDKNGVRQLKEKPYSPGNDPGPNLCKYCGKEKQPYDGKHYACYYGLCSRFMVDKNCPECKEFVKANTCHTCDR